MFNFKLGFYEKQKSIFKSVIETSKTGSLFKHLELDRILKEKDFLVQYSIFKNNAPIFSPRSFTDYLSKITGMLGERSIDILQQKNVISNKTPLAFVKYFGSTLPVYKESLDVFYKQEEYILQYLKDNNVLSQNGKVFWIFDSASISYEKNRAISGSFEAVLANFRPKKLQETIMPNLDNFSNIGKSRYQVIHAFIDYLEANGSKIEVIFATPKLLIQTFMVLSQRSGKVLTIEDICPNLKAFVYYHENYSLYKTEIDILIGTLKVKIIEMHIHPVGMYAIQDDLNVQHVLRIIDNDYTFYEYVSELDFLNTKSIQSSFTRDILEESKIGQNSILLLSNKSGIISYNTGKVWRIINKNPLKIDYIRPIERLNHFGEQLSEDQMNNILSEVNKILVNRGFFIRDYVMAGDITKGQNVFVFEVSKPVETMKRSVLEAVAKRIHTECMLANKRYDSLQKLSRVNPPQIVFVSTGTFVSMPDTFLVSRVDNTLNAENAKEIINRAISYITVDLPNEDQK